MMNQDDSFQPLQPGEPLAQPRGRGMKGGSPKTRFYRDQLMCNPGQWFVWKTKGPHASDSGGALRTLVGLKKLSGLDRKTLPYEATSRKQEDGTFTTFVRFVGNDQGDLVDAPDGKNAVINPFGN